MSETPKVASRHIYTKHDWAAIKADYFRMNLMPDAKPFTLHDLSKRWGLSYGAVRNKAGREKWPQELILKREQKVETTVQNVVEASVLDEFEIRTRQVKVARMVIAKASKELAARDFKTFTPRELTELLKLGAAMERDAAGIPVEVSVGMSNPQHRDFSVAKAKEVIAKIMNIVQPSLEQRGFSAIQLQKSAEAAYVMLPLAELKPHPRNARLHPPEQLAQIVKSIEQFGFIKPVLVDKNNVIIAGHGATAAAKLMGLTEVPCVRVSHLTPEKLRAYMIADNKLAQNSGWDDTLLKEELQSFLNTSVDFDSLGFSQDDLSFLNEHVKPDLRYLENFDVTPKPKPTWIMIATDEVSAGKITSAIAKLNLADTRVERSDGNG